MALSLAKLKACCVALRGSASAARPYQGQPCPRRKAKAAQQAEAAAVAHRETAEQKRQRIAKLEERARLFGDPVKQSVQAKVLERKWLRFLLVHGEEYGFDEREGPTVELVEHFASYCFCTRDRVSAIGREGLSDSFELQIRYMLAKFVFVALEYNGWTGLSVHELHMKAEPYKFAVRVTALWSCCTLALRSGCWLYSEWLLALRSGCCWFG
jgi:hypothetical protein